MAKARKWPEIIYVSHHDAFIDDGPFIAACPDKNAVIDQAEHGEQVAIFKLVKVMKARKTYDLA